MTAETETQVPGFQPFPPFSGSTEALPDRREVLRLRPSASAAGTHWIRVHRTAMACRFEVTLSDLDHRHVAAAHGALGDADRLERAWTLFRDSSLLVAVNQTAASHAVAIDEELFDLLSRCIALHADTDAAFDITTTPLSRCWGFLRREGRLPTGDEIAAALARVDMRAIELDASARTVRFARPGLELNLGSVGKGFAVGAIAARLRTAGLHHALVSAGSSSIAALGGRGRGWSIDLRSRQARHRRLARVWLRDGAMGTSGAGEQFIEIEGRRYGHVIDPRTGWPATGVLSATVIAADGPSADALATAFFIGGVELARRYCATHPGTLAILTPDDGVARPMVLGAYPGARVVVSDTGAARETERTAV